ncbi:MAG: hypothetical protein ACK58L_02580 [Planctomycetota bacterium]
MNSTTDSFADRQMPEDPQSLGPKFDQQVRVMQIIVAALLTGVLTFFGVVLVITGGNVFGQNKPQLLTMIAAVFAGMMVIAHVVVPSAISKTHVRTLHGNVQSDSAAESRIASLVGIYQTQLIVSIALLDGAAFFNLIALMTEQHVMSTIVAACLQFMILLKFPTRTKVTWWVQDRMREML